MERKKIFKGDPEWENALKQVSRITRWRALKRGWVFVNYQKKKIKIGQVSDNDIRFFYDVAGKVFHIYFKDFFGWRDDFIQEAVERCWELSGKSKDFSFLWRVCLNTMRHFQKKMLNKKVIQLSAMKNVNNRIIK